MGKMEVPSEALYGATTQRAVLNFPVSGKRLSRDFIEALALLKRAAALTNEELGDLEPRIAKAIVHGCDQVIAGDYDEHFVVDIFQTGSGTSTNMNANEVIANLAIQQLGGKIGDRALVHPNDHVNMSQSSNDIIPSAIHVSALLSFERSLLPALQTLRGSLDNRAQKFKDVIKSGRTHLQDATPITLGQEFSGYVAQIDMSIARLQRSAVALRDLALGGTAVGTGLNTKANFAKTAIAKLSTAVGSEFREAPNHFAAQASQDAVVEFSGQLKTLGCALMKIANDIRWLAAGPRCSLAEIRLPEIQPGSSIMPAKVNPVVCESVMMVCAQVIGNDTAITVGGQHGNFELNVMLPMIANNILDSITILAGASQNFAVRCVDGIEANEEQCLKYAELSLATCTSLAPVIGYDLAAKVAKTAFEKGQTVREAALEMQVLPPDELKRVLDLRAMTIAGAL
jgi:fumarate hydratase class II